MTDQTAVLEAGRCLQCFDAPCTRACPVHIDIPGFIAMMRSHNPRGAAEVVKRANALANSCGAVCPQEIYCQRVCNRAKLDAPVEIRSLHAYATAYEARRGFSPLVPFPKPKRRVAVVGSGPAGLSCAFELVKLGYRVDIFEGHSVGGIPKRSIPGFRLPEDVLDQDLGFLSRHFTLKNRAVNEGDLQKLRKTHDALFLGIGLGLDRKLGIEGEQLPGVIPVLRFLELGKSRPRKAGVEAGERVVVIGGGNVSLDAAATAKHMGAADVVLLYRRSEKEMRVWRTELDVARSLGVEQRFLTAPVRIVGTRRVTGVLCTKTRLSRRKDASGRPLPVEVKGSEHLICAEKVIVAVGQEIPPGVFQGLRKTSSGFIRVDEDYLTSLRGVFAGGDAVTGEGTIVLSVAHGRAAAHAMHRYLTGK